MTNKIKPLFHVVLFQPEIPDNTGAIGRTCVGVGAKLWLVRPLGFQIEERRLKRAGLDYWPNLDWEIVDNWSHLLDRLAEDFAEEAREAMECGAACDRTAISPAPLEGVSEVSRGNGWARAFPRRMWLLTKRGVADYIQADLRKGDVFVFGAESTGLPQEILDAHPDRCLKIPIQPGIRCLNLSVSVGVTLFEARRQAYLACIGG